jgi:predicted membrane protein
MTDHDDFAFEPLPGLPARPPVGEEILWQGRPSTWALAVDAFKLYWIAGYMIALALWRASIGYDMGGLGMAIAVALPHLALAALVCQVVLLLAYAQARATMYTITSARVVMRIGAALSVTFNLPFAQIGAAKLDLRRNGTGTIALETLGTTRISYLVAWPHARPWHFGKAHPALRCIPEATRVARVLRDAAEQRLSVPVIARKDAAAIPTGALAADVGAPQ